ncbi:MAG: heavy metal translocating P-type ATPase [Flavobacteriaceae bacterium]|nr:heavy metal translocating P-type ATPase [Flavobacteriaceae bacterium]
MKSILQISGMTCEGCRSSVEDKLGTLDGVDKVQVDLTRGQAVIYSKNPVNLSLIKETLPPKYSLINEENVNLDAHGDITIKASKIQQLKPLFIILGYIFIASILLNYKNWNSSNAMLDFMGLFYIIFSFFKILDIKGFSKSFRMYDPLAKQVPIYGYIYPFIEVILGMMFLLRFEVNIALILTVIVLGITTIGVTQTLINKRSIKCACLGTTLNLPMTEATFIENALMIIMAFSLIFS